MKKKLLIWPEKSSQAAYEKESKRKAEPPRPPTKREIRLLLGPLISRGRIGQQQLRRTLQCLCNNYNNSDMNPFSNTHRPWKRTIHEWVTSLPQEAPTCGRRARTLRDMSNKGLILIRLPLLKGFKQLKLLAYVTLIWTSDVGRGGTA